MDVVLIAVVSLDGRITRPDQPGAGFASEADQVWFRRALREFDTSIMGRRTFATIRESLRGNRNAERHRVILTRTPEACSPDSVPDVLEFTDQPPEEIVQGLARRGRRHCALLGGGEVYRLFVEAGLVDTLWLSIEPVLLGGGTPLLDGPVGEKSFDLFEVRHLSQNTLLLNYTRRGGLPRPLPPP